MSIFGSNYQRQSERLPTAAEDDNPGSPVTRWIMCDGCHVARAQVEVITAAGSVFLCQHHHVKHRSSIIAAGHQIRVGLGDPRSL